MYSYTRHFTVATEASQQYVNSAVIKNIADAIAGLTA